MRLSASELQTIRTAAAEAFGMDVVVRLFGSRTDAGKRGGDIDLHVEVPPGVPVEAAERMRRRFWILLQDRLGEQKIDIVTHTAAEGVRPIDRLAYETGIEL